MPGFLTRWLTSIMLVASMYMWYMFLPVYIVKGTSAPSTVISNHNLSHKYFFAILPVTGCIVHPVTGSVLVSKLCSFNYVPDACHTCQVSFTASKPIEVVFHRINSSLVATSPGITPAAITGCTDEDTQSPAHYGYNDCITFKPFPQHNICDYLSCCNHGCNTRLYSTKFSMACWFIHDLCIQIYMYKNFVPPPNLCLSQNLSVNCADVI